MQVAGQDQVDPAAGEDLHRQRGAADDIVAVLRRPALEGMVRDDDADQAERHAVEPRARRLDLLAADATVLEGEAIAPC